MRSLRIVSIFALSIAFFSAELSGEEPRSLDIVEALPVVEESDTAPDSVAPSAETTAEESGESVPFVLDLRAAQQLALEKNPTLFAAAARVDQARARVRQARSLYLPQLDAVFSATHTHLPSNTVNAAKDQALLSPLTSSLRGSIPQALFDTGEGGGVEGALFSSIAGLYSGLQARGSVDESVENYQASLTASYILFDGFSRRFTNAMARFGREESEAAHREAVRLVLDAIAQSYYGVQLARENASIARADESFNERLLKEARLRKERGTGSKSDVLNFEVALRAAQSARIQAEGQEQVARVALAALMGLQDAKLGEAVEIAPLPEEVPEDLHSPNLEEMIGEAMTTRPDIQQGEFQVARIEAQLGERRSSYYPQVRTFASQRASASDNARFEQEDFGATVGVDISYGIFAGGRNRATVAEARHQLEEAEYLLEALRLGATEDIRRSGIILQTAQETLALQRTTAEYVQANRDLVEKEYEAGQGSLARLNQAQRDLVAAEARLALARVALYSAWHALETATGETISHFEGCIPCGEAPSE
ncbi:MAG: TolC family protein [Candidatus Hydrogenedentes bacterium]|nr:TolC family protein [Candidatus Hydrogenedentota bacterium]